MSLFKTADEAADAVEAILTDSPLHSSELTQRLRSQAITAWRSGRASGLIDGERLGWIKGFTAAARSAVDKARDILDQAVRQIDGMEATLTDGS